MIPRALRSRPRAMARPARPLAEGAAVRAAADIVRAETGFTAAEPIAKIIALRVVEEMQAYLAEDMDPFLAALGEAKRRAAPSPFAILATDPQSDSVSLFVDARVERLRARSGRGQTYLEEQIECRQLWERVSSRLKRRYLRALR